MSEPKRFEDWTQVDCNDCQHYWTDACDGVSKGTQKPCSSFLATKRVDIPLQIKRIRQRQNGLDWAFVFLAIAILINYAVDLMGG